VTARSSARAATALIAALACITPTLATPSSASAFSKAIWGPATRNGVNQFPLYRQLGVSIYQLQLDWSQVAPTQPAHPSNPGDPAYQWPASVGQAISEADSYHMRVLIQLIDAPAWADGGHAGAGWAPQSARSFVAFTKAAAKEYPSVHLWMIWGEPTKFGNFQPLAAALPGQPLDAAQRAADELYAEMVNGAYGVLKALDHSNLVIGGCTYTTGAVDTLQWIKYMRLPNGKRPRMDMYAHNPFTYESPLFTTLPNPFDEVQFANLPELAHWIDQYLRKGMPLFLSEWEIPTAPDDTFNFWVNQNTAAKWVTEAMRESRAWHRIYALGWINVYDDLPLVSGGLLTQSGKPKPDFYAFEHG
jgi:hypothetical protein